MGRRWRCASTCHASSRRCPRRPGRRGTTWRSSRPGRPRRAVRRGQGRRYGHGPEDVAAVAVAAGADRLAVALVEEGQELRDVGIDAPVLVLSQPPPDAMVDAFAAGLNPTVDTAEGIAASLPRPAGRRGRFSSRSTPACAPRRLRPRRRWSTWPAPCSTPDWSSRARSPTWLSPMSPTAPRSTSSSSSSPRCSPSSPRRDRPLAPPRRQPAAALVHPAARLDLVRRDATYGVFLVGRPGAPGPVGAR